ncbi:Krueppel homolog 2 [Culicoides brevitarsis]|uniref:Krueppel homolog 2 n=1 Tax=Culicoides brevitarsis TaxID=469753 RepID=UPI00307BAA83
MSDNSTQQEQQPARGFEALKAHVIANKIDSALWASRVLTILFAVGYVIPLFGNAQSAYYKIFMANAMTSALRLHQRMPRIAFTREYLSLLLMEDSCHYLFFSLIYLYVAPVILIPIPIVLFAILHSASYSLTLLDTLGQNSWWGARLLISLVEFQTRNILRLAAFSEIFLMPLVIILVFLGRAGIMTPFIYYHFLVLRYSSRRNPYTRNMFYELRIATEAVANNPRAPAMVRKILHGGVRFVSRLAPPTQPAQQ